MPTDSENHDKVALNNAMIARLMRETEITVEQATELVLFLGVDWPSLMREARALKASRFGGEIATIRLKS